MCGHCYNKCQFIHDHRLKTNNLNDKLFNKYKISKEKYDIWFWPYTDKIYSNEYNISLVKNNENLDGQD